MQLGQKSTSFVILTAHLSHIGREQVILCGIKSSVVVIVPAGKSHNKVASLFLQNGQIIISRSTSALFPFLLNLYKNKVIQAFRCWTFFALTRVPAAGAASFSNG